MPGYCMAGTLRSGGGLLIVSTVQRRSSTNSVNCTEEELTSVLERALVIQQYPIIDNMSIDAAVGVRIGETK